MTLNERGFPFLSDFRVLDVAEGTQVHAYELEQDFAVYSGVLNARITVPKGFTFDGESIPAGLAWLVRPMGESRRGACVHDYLYRFAGYKNLKGEFVSVTRSQADAVYRELIEANGLPAWRATVRWAVLRSVGWAAWGGNKATHGMLSLFVLSLLLSSCGLPWQRLGANAAADALAAGEGYLVAGQAGAIAYGTRQEVKNLQAWTSAKQTREVRP